MLPLSLIAWRRLRASPRAEAVLALTALGATALLSAFPLPPAQLEAAQGLEQPAGAAAALPQPGDLTLGGRAGDSLVGLTVRPARPGTNDVFVYLLPPQGDLAASGVSVDLVVDGARKRMRPCGLSCRHLRVDLVGGELLTVAVGPPLADTEQFKLPQLPAPSGTEMVQRFESTMRDLRSVRIDEVLGPASPPVRTTYWLQAPDRLHYQIATGAETIFIGGKRYSRDRANRPWQVEANPPLSEPAYAWDFAPAQDARLLGTASVEGEMTEEVAFFETAGGNPAWFICWVDPQGRVLRLQMRAQAHFMDHIYSQFDAAPAIVRPV